METTIRLSDVARRRGPVRKSRPVTPTSKGELPLAGAVAGAIGGAAMAAWMVLHAGYAGWGAALPMRLVGAALYGDAALGAGGACLAWGILLHAVASVGWGVVFAALVPRRWGYGASAVLASAFAMLVLVVMTFVVLPAFDPQLRGYALDAPTSWLLGHVLFGLGVATVPGLRRLADRDRQLAQIIPLPLHRTHRRIVR